MDDYLFNERADELWAKTWDKSSEAFKRISDTYAEQGDYLNAAKYQVVSDTYKQVATDMRLPRQLRLEYDEREH